MAGDTPAAPPPKLRLFSGGVRFIAPGDPIFQFLPQIFPIFLQAVDAQEAARQAWQIFKSGTYDEKSGTYELLGHSIFPFHVGVVDCTDFLQSLADKVSKESARQKTKEDEVQKPKRTSRKTEGNVVELFPGTGQPKKPAGKGKGSTGKTPPKKPPRTPTKK